MLLIPLKEIGFDRKINRRNVITKITELGLPLCPPEVGPQLRLQYKDQLPLETIHVAMNPIFGTGYLSGDTFSLQGGNALWVSKGMGLYGPNSKYVFCLQQ